MAEDSQEFRQIDPATVKWDDDDPLDHVGETAPVANAAAIRESLDDLTIPYIPNAKKDGLRHLYDAALPDASEFGDMLLHDLRIIITSLSPITSYYDEIKDETYIRQHRIFRNDQMPASERVAAARAIIERAYNEFRLPDGDITAPASEYTPAVPDRVHDAFMNRTGVDIDPDNKTDTRVPTPAPHFIADFQAQRAHLADYYNVVKLSEQSIEFLENPTEEHFNALYANSIDVNQLASILRIPLENIEGTEPMNGPLATIFLNLLANARKAPGSTPLTVQITNPEPGAYTIENPSVTELSRDLFAPGKTGAGGNTGWGLAIVTTYADLLGMEVAVENVPIVEPSAIQEGPTSQTALKDSVTTPRFDVHVTLRPKTSNT